MERLRWLVLVLIFACREDPGARDQAALRAALIADETLDQALREADKLERSGRGDDAADLLERKAKPAAEQALTAAQGTLVKTDWGRKQKDTMVTLATDRKSAVGRYIDVLRNGKDDDKVAALVQQVDLERRAISLSNAILGGP